jgi:hypothetical protein
MTKRWTFLSNFGEIFKWLININCGNNYIPNFSTKCQMGPHGAVIWAQTSVSQVTNFLISPSINFSPCIEIHMSALITVEYLSFLINAFNSNQSSHPSIMLSSSEWEVPEQNENIYGLIWGISVKPSPEEILTITDNANCRASLWHGFLLFIQHNEIHFTIIRIESLMIVKTNFFK